MTIALSHAPRGLMVHEDVVLEKVVNMASRKSKKNQTSKASRINSVRMEIMMADLVALPIPENKPGVISPIKLIVGITNKTSSSFPLNLPGSLIPELVGLDGQTLKLQKSISSQFESRLNNWILVRAGEAVGISLDARLFWRNNLLQLVIPTNPDYWHIPITPENTWTFDALLPGTYQMRFTFDRPSRDVLSSISSNPQIRQQAELYGINTESLATALEDISTDNLATPFVNLCLVQPVENNKCAVEVDGICFETLIPEHTLSVPNKQPGATIQVQLGIRISNNKQTPVRFSFYNCFIPELATADGQIIPGSYYMDWLGLPQESDFSLAMPGEDITFYLYAQMSWLEGDKFQLLIAVGNGGFWIFKPINLGDCQIHLTYRSSKSLEKVDEQESLKKKLIENIWTGMVSMPFLNISLV